MNLPFSKYFFTGQPSFDILSIYVRESKHNAQKENVSQVTLVYLYVYKFINQTIMTRLRKGTAKRQMFKNDI